MIRPWILTLCTRGTLAQTRQIYPTPNETFMDQSVNDRPPSSQAGTDGTQISMWENDPSCNLDRIRLNEAPRVLFLPPENPGGFVTVESMRT